MGTTKRAAWTYLRWGKKEKKEKEKKEKEKKDKEKKEKKSKKGKDGDKESDKDQSMLSDKDRSMSDKDRSMSDNERSMSDKDRSMSDKDRSMSDKDRSMSEKDRSMSEKDRSISDKVRSIFDKSKSASDKNKSMSDKDRAMSDKDRAMTDKDKSMSDKDRSMSDKDRSMSDKDRSMSERERSLLSETLETSKSVIKPYEYDEEDDKLQPTRLHRFSYENPSDGSSSFSEKPISPSGKRATALAFNYAPGEEIQRPRRDPEDTPKSSFKPNQKMLSDLQSPNSYNSRDPDDSLSSAMFPYGGTPDSAGPKIVKTTTKQSIVKDGSELTQNIEEKVENVTTGDFTLSTQVNKAEGLEDPADSHMTATAVTTRTAMTTEDLGTNAKTSQVEEKTVARTTRTSATSQEQRVVTQQMMATSKTLIPENQIQRKMSTSSTSSNDSGTPIDDENAPPTAHNDQLGDGTFLSKRPIVETESVFYNNSNPMTLTSTSDVPLVPTSSQTLFKSSGGDAYTLDAELLSSQTITSKTRTVETVTYKKEKDGVVETHVEQKITIQSDGDRIDHDKALAEAIQEATAMNPDLTVEKIEIQQQQ